MRIQRSSEHRIVPWANGLGITADVSVFPPGTHRWEWRLSIADVTDDVPFSSMPGIDRTIMVAQGAGMALVIDGAQEVPMLRTSPPLAFSGDSTTTCRLLDGPIADLNLMTRRGSAIGTMRVLSLSTGEAATMDGDDVAVVVLEGMALVGDEEITTFDAVLNENGVAITITAVEPCELAVATVNLVT